MSFVASTKCIRKLTRRIYALRNFFRAPRRPYCEVDPRIKSLVDTMNATGGIRTVASCEGHGRFGMPPYVLLKTSIDVASSIERQLRIGAGFSNPQTHATWVIEGRFDENLELSFILYAPEYHEKSFSIKRVVFLSPFRKKVDADLLFLEKITREIVIADIWDSNKPEVNYTDNGGDDHRNLA